MIKPGDQFAALHMAFRYALGRSTYVSYEVAALLRNAWPKMDKRQRWMIKSEIVDAVLSDSAGMEQDRAEWQSILELGL